MDNTLGVVLIKQIKLEVISSARTYERKKRDR